MTRQRYLSDLAAIMHCPPPAVDGLRIADFAQLLIGIDEERQRRARLGLVAG